MRESRSESSADADGGAGEDRGWDAGRDTERGSERRSDGGTGTGAHAGSGTGAQTGSGNGAYAFEQTVAVQAAEEAGALLRAGFRQAHTVRSKGEGGDVVTDLDLAAEKVILDRLRTHFPHERIVSEEAGLLDAHGSRTWLVDPLDGSNNVAIGLTAYAVGIALCVDGSPVVGVVHEPVTGRTWRATAGRGAWCGTARVGGPCGTLPRSGPVLAWTQGHAVARGDERALALRGALELHSRRVLQLWAPLLGWTMLASGTIDGYVGYRAEGIDFPAGALLAAEAGVEFRTLSGGEFQVGFDGPDSGRSFVAARGETLPHLVDLAGRAGAGNTTS
ncbi:inositol monophosphatase family protein [Streptomyces sp. HNM0575]|uniref:inositol monophosphatase family protein n=1 Tax=Streptomyces sp. HNM0575 TaxID=2716338 RepID=UPI00145CF02B|nr:inositol monophosphatase family protein [Streptomyces sp. HNM0575]NLU72791.1 inositol monophosphatase family protein [Streptomyces sp. HNM0575]